MQLPQNILLVIVSCNLPHTQNPSACCIGSRTYNCSVHIADYLDEVGLHLLEDAAKSNSRDSIPMLQCVLLKVFTTPTRISLPVITGSVSHSVLCHSFHFALFHATYIFTLELR